MYYRVEIQRIESGLKWITPYYFTKRKDADKEAAFWANGIWKISRIIESKKKIGGISKITEQRMINKDKKKISKSKKDTTHETLHKLQKEQMNRSLRASKKIETTTSKRLLKELRGGK